MRKEERERDKNLSEALGIKDEDFGTRTIFCFLRGYKVYVMTGSLEYRESNDPVRNASGLLIQQSDFLPFSPLQENCAKARGALCPILEL